MLGNLGWVGRRRGCNWVTNSSAFTLAYYSLMLAIACYSDEHQTHPRTVILAMIDPRACRGTLEVPPVCGKSFRYGDSWTFAEF